MGSSMRPNKKHTKLRTDNPNLAEEQFPATQKKYIRAPLRVNHHSVFFAALPSQRASSKQENAG